MTDESKIMANAAKAKKILNDEFFSDLLSEVENDIHAEWRETKANDVDGREELWYALWGLKAIIARLKGKVDSGTILEKQKEMNNG